MVSDEDLARLKAEIRKYPEDHDGDDEQAGYVQGLKDAARILRGLKPKYRGLS